MSWQQAAAAFGLQTGGQIFSVEEQNKQSAKEAQKTRDFSERMSSTAYQRAAADLEAAGLNRVLALGSPASTPSGAQAPVAGADLGSVISTGIQAASAKQSIDQSKAQTALLDEQEKTEGLRQYLTQQQAEQARTQAISNAESARKTRIDADRAEVLNPLYKTAGDVVDWGVDKLRSSAKDFDDSAINKQINEVIDKVTGRQRNVPRNEKGIEIDSWRDRADKWFNSRKKR